MEKIKFIENKKYNDKGAIPTEDRFTLLSYFVDGYREEVLNDVIADLNDLLKGVKTFDEIQEPNGYWTFGNGAGYLEADKDVAHFIAWDETHQSFDMPLQELIDLLKEWEAFLGE
jgi:hypothetical protein